MEIVHVQIQMLTAAAVPSPCQLAANLLARNVLALLAEELALALTLCL